MGYLKQMSETEYRNSTVEYPTVVYVGQVPNGFIRFTAPTGYEILDTSTECLLCADGDFLVKSE